MATNHSDNEVQRPASTLSDKSTQLADQAALKVDSNAIIDSSNSIDSSMSASYATTSSKKSARAVKPSKPIAPMHKALVITWLLWLVYRLLGMPILISVINPVSPDIVGGIVWYGLWLIPAIILTPVILRGRSPYMLLVGSMLTLVYLGASGVTLFIRVYGSSWLELVVYGFDFALLLMVNAWLFLLLKRLPSMNNVVKKPRAH